MQNEQEQQGQMRLLYTREHLRRLGVLHSNTSLLRMEADGRWPARVRLSERSVAWLKIEVDAHIAALAERRGKSS